MRSLFFFSLSLFTLICLAPINKAIAQLNPDSSLGAESSIVNPPDINDGIPSNIPSDRIDGGATRGSNLFHSFQDFNVGAGRGVYFSNPANITNILTRVTGGNRSNILGTLGVLGNANLFLINPRGISFGPNASLDLRGGSFFSSTADSVLFDNFEFSASNLQPVPQLTINIPIGLRFRDNPQPVTNNSFAQDINGNFVGLQVAPGKTLALVGGDVNFNTGFVVAPGARVELGGLSQAGIVGLNSDGSLSFPNGVAPGNVSFNNFAFVDVSYEGGGSIAVNANNVNILGKSGLFAGIKPGSDTPGAQAGDISLNATGTIRLEEASYIFNRVYSNATGNAGNINVTTNSLLVTGGAQLSSSTRGRGNAGNITINADTVSFDGTDNQGFPSAAFTIIEAGGEGKGGDISITARLLSLTNGGQLNTFVREATTTNPGGIGDAGNVKLNISDTTNITGVSDNGVRSNIFSGVESGAKGNAGNIEISTGSLFVTDGGQISSSISGKGDAGNITINARNRIEIAGGNDKTNLGDDFYRSRIISRVGNQAEGNAGNIKIDTKGSLLVTGGAQLSSSTRGKGNAGNITINADTVSFDGTDKIFSFPSAAFSTIEAGGEGKGGDISITARLLSLTNGGQLNTFVRQDGNGNAGNVKLNISDTINIAGISDKRDFTGIYSRSGIFSSLESGAKGNAGNIEITTGSLFVSNGGQLFASTRAKGNAGNITINADTVSFDGRDNIIRFPSAAFSTIETGGNGKGGDISITARSLSLTNGGELNTFIRRGGNGTAGNVKLNISDTINIAGVNSGIFSNVLAGGTGNGGNIEIYKGSLFVSDGGQITASTSGRGNAGRIKIDANSLFVDGGKLITNSDVENRQAGNIEITTAKDIRLDNRALISATTKGGQGNIILKSRDLIMRRNSNIRTDATGTAAGGNITIDTGNLVAFPKENSDISANAQKGYGGNVLIDAARVFGTQFRTQSTPESDITANSDLGSNFSGTVQIDTTDVDPAQGLSELPENTTDPSSQIAQNPCQKGSGSVFIVTGRGGIPSSPNDSFNSDNVRVDLLQPVTSNDNQNVTNNPVKIQTATKEIIPAQGWVFNEKGEVVLTAYDPTTSGSQRSSKIPASCPAPF
ncbi:hypothetical protein AMR41_02895 [Hapalosiphon sp. MRB220]|nr:hypothetical protein AMR41_02895 [Hapalosiphon sp. MRB220]